MPIIRNPFRKQDENVRLIDTSVATRVIDIKQPVEYKLSEINDSGVYLPPSPTENSKNFWSNRSATSTTSSATSRSILSPDEPFHMSRESFDSYRRSFDISARSPVLGGEPRPRASLDLRSTTQTRPSISFARPETTKEEEFENVGLGLVDEHKTKKRGFFGRFGDNSDSAAGTEHKSVSHHGFHIGGRRRGQSGSGEELGEIKKPIDQL